MVNPSSAGPLALASAGDEGIVSVNAYNNAGWKYVSTGIASTYYMQTGGTHRWYNAASGTAGNAITFTQAMTLDASGLLGIGVTSPQARLDVRGTSGPAFGNRNGILLYNTNSSGNQSNTIGFGSAGSANAACFITTDNPADGTGIYALSLGATGSTGVINFLTNGTERARIDSSGNLLVGLTSTVLYLDGKTNSSSSSAPAFCGRTSAGSGTFTNIAWNDATSGDNGFVAFGTEGTFTTRGAITYNRAGGLVAYNVTSDYRAKDIYGSIADSGSLIDSVPVYMGKMKGATQERPMFIAHETPAYAHTGEKDAVDKDGNPVYQQMDTSALVPVMWAEIQSLRKRLAALESA
jgi:hypothetical protein